MVCASLVCILMSGCATVTKSTFLGIGTGAALGAASGAVFNSQDRGQGAMYGALGMAVIGGIAGYFTHQGLEDRDAQVRQDTLFNLEKFGVTGFNSNPGYQNDSGLGASQRGPSIFNDESNRKQNKQTGDK